LSYPGRSSRVGGFAGKEGKLFTRATVQSRNNPSPGGFLTKMRFTIFKRLSFGYAAIMFLVVFLGVYVALKLREIDHLTKSVSSVHSAAIVLAEQVQSQVLSQEGFGKKYLISKDPDFYKRVQEIKGAVIEDLTQLSVLLVTPETQAALDRIRKLYERHIVLLDEEVAATREGPDDSREEYRVEKEKIVDQINSELNGLIQSARQERDRKIELSNQISSRVLKVSALAAGLVIVVGLLISFLNTKTINRSILLLQKGTKQFAKGKFETIRNIHSPPEIKELADDFNIMGERLEELDEMKLDFVRHVSHELRTPLTAISEAISMLLEKGVADTSEKQNELLAIAKEECVRLISSVNRILDLSRMEANMMDYHLQESDISTALRRAVLKLAPIARSKKIDLEIKPLANLPPVRMDEERIGQVIDNLLGNALKFTPPMGKITIETRLVKNEKKRFIVTGVKDTGCGISSENLGEIFDKFKRIETGRETARGTGLGLPIAKHIIAAHGGRIWVKSKPGKGSTFFFALPV
jgi:two-component system sensor histidine kinase GlrK